MKLNRYFMFAALMTASVCVASAKSEGQLGALASLTSEMEGKIQAQVLDSILGQGKAFVFMEIKVEVKSTAEEEGKDGVGELHKKFPEGAAEDELAAFDNGKASQDKTIATKVQLARQTKKSANRTDVVYFIVSSMKLRILHDAALSADSLKTVKEALQEIYSEKIKTQEITFVPAAFSRAQNRKSAGIK